MTTPSPTFIRSDLRDPVLVFNTETDAGALQARQPDTPWFRLWEATGTAHYDQYGLVHGATDTGDLDAVTEWFDTMSHPTSQPIPNFNCASPINTGPQSFVLRAAVDSLNTLGGQGQAPTDGRLGCETVSISPLEYEVDANGNVLGGIRTPAVDAPSPKLSGLGQSGSQFCFLFGTTIPLSPSQLDALYSSHQDFVSKWKQSTNQARAAGFLMKEDAEHLKQAAANSRIPD